MKTVKLVYLGTDGETRMDERPLKHGEAVEVPEGEVEAHVETGLFAVNEPAWTPPTRAEMREAIRQVVLPEEGKG